MIEKEKDVENNKVEHIPSASGILITDSSAVKSVCCIPSEMATETKPAAAEDSKIDLFKDDDEFEKFEISQDDGIGDFWLEDDLSNDISDDGLSHASVLNREGRWRHHKNHTMGYRDGITAGKEASAQEGFNDGFRQSVHVGYRWGLVRGITSALDGLSDSSKEKLVRKFENRDRFLNLYKSVQAISANDALKMYSDSILQNGSGQSQDHLEGRLQEASLTDDDSSSNKLDSLYEDLISLLHDTPEINVNAIKT